MNLHVVVEDQDKRNRDCKVVKIDLRWDPQQVLELVLELVVDHAWEVLKRLVMNLSEILTHNKEKQT